MGLRHLIHAHPVAATAVGLGTIAMANKDKWTRGTARVRDYQTIQDGNVLVEMDDDNIFVADPEVLPSLYAAKKSGTLVRYWINNHKSFYKQPRGGLGDDSPFKGFMGF
jgi:hypothetical protein